MEFLGIGYQELLLVLGLLLVVVGPERLPGMAYQLGRAVRTMQSYARAVRDEFKDEIDYLDEQYKTVKGQVDEAQREMRIEQQKLNAELREVSANVDAAAALVANDPAAAPSSSPAAIAAPAAETPTEKPAEPAKPPMVF
ncbi:MAG: Sec-independent protein translocase protein TatB [Dehalococcoidia bacterium]